MKKPVMLVLMLMMSVWTGCGEPSDPDAYQVAVIPKAVGFDFWNSVRSGADGAAYEVGNVNVLWRGPSDETDIAGQVSLVENFINSRVDAIVIAASDSRGLVPVLRRARDRGIAVITIDSNTDPQISESFIATNNKDAAAQAADLLAERLGGSGKVALIPYIAGASTSNEREAGFREGLERHKGLELVAVQYSQSDYGRAMTVTEDILTAHSDLRGIFAANEPSVLGAMRAISQRGLSNRVKLVGFDASPRQLEGVRNGTIEGLIVQDPYRMGYEGVMQAVRVLEGEEVESYIDSGSTIVTIENIDEFLEAQDGEIAVQ